MTEAEARAAIHAYFASGWGTTTAVHYDDELKPKPDDGAFSRLTVRHSAGFQATKGNPGNNRHEILGGITVQIFVPQGNAGITAMALASQAAALFRGKRTGDIAFYDTSIREIGNDGAGFYQVNVNVRFRYSIFA